MEWKFPITRVVIWSGIKLLALSPPNIFLKTIWGREPWMLRKICRSFKEKGKWSKWRNKRRKNKNKYNSMALKMRQWGRKSNFKKLRKVKIKAKWKCIAILMLPAALKMQMSGMRRMISQRKNHKSVFDAAKKVTLQRTAIWKPKWLVCFVWGIIIIPNAQISCVFAVIKQAMSPKSARPAGKNAIGAGKSGTLRKIVGP